MRSNLAMDLRRRISAPHAAASRRPVSTS